MYNLAMKLVIQIPCFNEEQSISDVIKSIPKKIKGIDEIKIFIIDDGSNDKTVENAINQGVDKIISFKKRSGLSAVFKKGIEEALKEKADILVNLDGDNQYCAYDIEKLISPILENECDISIGVRPIDKIKSFSKLKKILQKLGSKITKLLTNIDVLDAASGFRAFNRSAILNLNVFNPFTYTIETIIQAKYKNLIIKNVEISVNEQKNRKSKLFKNNFDYIFKQAKNLIRFFIIYRPARFFVFISFLFLIPAFIIGFRFLYFYFIGFGKGHIQSLILCAILFFMSFISFALAILGDLLSINRKLLEDIQYEIKEEKYKK